MNNPIAPLSTYQKEFIDFLVETEVLTFGDFVTKSGRKTPYFVNTGRFHHGSHISRLGQFYAAHIKKIGLSDVQTVFGPAYKGIPLCVTTALSMYERYQVDVGFCFNRKEEKTHGDRGNYVGAPLRAGDPILIIEDVITAGITLRATLKQLKEDTSVDVRGVIIAVDRCERGETDRSAADEIERDLGTPIYPLVTIHEIIEYLSQPNTSGFTLSEDSIQRMQQYLSEYGA